MTKWLKIWKNQQNYSEEEYKVGAKFRRVHSISSVGDDLLECTKCHGYFIWMRSRSMISSGNDPGFCPHCGVKFENPLPNFQKRKPIRASKAKH